MSTSDSNCKVGASKSNDDVVCDVNDKLQNMRIGAAVSTCANCGKDGANNVCNKCKQVRYCNAVCKKVHKKKHKKDCEEHIRLATEKHNKELRIAAEKHDEELFKEPPSQHGDCPICFLRIPSHESGYRYKTCCGKVICCGCVHAPVYDDQGNEVSEKKCAFCRTLVPYTDEEMLKRNKKRSEANDPIAICRTGNWYFDGLYGYPQDYTKALEHWHRAAELGYIEAYCFVGYVFLHGDGVEVDEKKAKHYWELGAMRGNISARYNLGASEEQTGNLDRAIKHYMIAVLGGHAKSLDLDVIKEKYSNGYSTKDDYTAALQLYQAYLGEIKSPQRDKAAETYEEYRYY